MGSPEAALIRGRSVRRVRQSSTKRDKPSKFISPFLDRFKLRETHEHCEYHPDREEYEGSTVAIPLLTHLKLP